MPYVIVAHTGFCEYFLDRAGWRQARLRDAATWDSSYEARKFLDTMETKDRPEPLRPLELRWMDQTRFEESSAVRSVRSAIGMRLQMRMR